MLVCSRCHSTFDISEPIWRCTCGSPLVLEKSPVAFPPGSKEKNGIWRYFDDRFFPGDSLTSLGEGGTPLVERCVNGVPVWLKLDYLCPTGSYKDRGMAVLVSRLKAMGIRHVVEDSSGNAGSSMAAYCAAAGIACDVYVPEYTSAGKCVQIAAYGAKLVRIPGTREDTTHAAEKAGESSFYASHNWSPWFPEGIKTWFLEVWERLPQIDNLVVPVGQGSIALGAWLAIEQLREMGLMQRMPRILAVQAENCAPLAEAFYAGGDVPAKIEKKETVAEGIASAEPVRGAEVLEAVRRTKGMFVMVNEDEIWSAFEDLAQAGIYVEPTSAATVAGWKKLLESGVLNSAQHTVLFLSGTGLKATDKIGTHRELLK